MTEYTQVSELATMTLKSSYSSVPVENMGANPDLQRSSSTTSVTAMKSSGKWEIDYSELEFEKQIGRGQYGVVFRGKWYSDLLGLTN